MDCYFFFLFLLTPEVVKTTFSRSTLVAFNIGETRLTFEVFVEDVLKAVEDGFVVFDFPAFAGLRPRLAALKVRVHFARVGRVLFVMRYLEMAREHSQKVSQGRNGRALAA